MVYSTLLLFLSTATAVRISSIFLDGCNLDLQLQSTLPVPTVCSLECDSLLPKLDTLSRYFFNLEPPSEDAVEVDCADAADVTVVFDGAAFHGYFQGREWYNSHSDELPGLDIEGADLKMVSESSIEHTGESALAGSEGTDGVRVLFTKDRLSSADDTLLALSRTAGADSSTTALPKTVTAKQAIALIEKGGLPSPCIAVTRTRSQRGKSQRERREAFLNNAGMPRVGDTAHFPSFTNFQRERSLGLLKGLHKLGDCVTYKQLVDPVALIATNDRGLRRRCLSLPCPPVILSRGQFFSMLESMESDRAVQELSTEDKEEVLQ